MCNDNIDGVCGSTLPYGNIGCGVSTSGETNFQVSKENSILVEVQNGKTPQTIETTQLILQCTER